MKINYYIIPLLISSSILLSFTLLQVKPWPVPDKFNKMASPIKADAEVIKSGKVLWIKHCASCHGKTGLGDGTKAAQLETAMEDMTTAAVQNQSDGALFYKISEGRDEMPSFKKKIADEEELWQIVHYVRTLKAK